MKAEIVFPLLVLGAGYLAHMAWTGEVRTRNGVFFGRGDDPTMFWYFWTVGALAYAWLLYAGVAVVLDPAR